MKLLNFEWVFRELFWLYDFIFIFKDEILGYEFILDNLLSLEFVGLFCYLLVDGILESNLVVLLVLMFCFIYVCVCLKVIIDFFIMFIYFIFILINEGNKSI